MTRDIPGMSCTRHTSPITTATLLDDRTIYHKASTSFFMNDKYLDDNADERRNLMNWSQYDRLWAIHNAASQTEEI